MLYPPKGSCPPLPPQCPRKQSQGPLVTWIQGNGPRSSKAECVCHQGFPTPNQRAYPLLAQQDFKIAVDLCLLCVSCSSSFLVECPCQLPSPIVHCEGQLIYIFRCLFVGPRRARFRPIVMTTSHHSGNPTVGIWCSGSIRLGLFAGMKVLQEWEEEWNRWLVMDDSGGRAGLYSHQSHFPLMRTFEDLFPSLACS